MTKRQKLRQNKPQVAKLTNKKTNGQDTWQIEKFWTSDKRGKKVKRQDRLTNPFW